MYHVIVHTKHLSFWISYLKSKRTRYVRLLVDSDICLNFSTVNVVWMEQLYVKGLKLNCCGLLRSKSFDEHHNFQCCSLNVMEPTLSIYCNASTGSNEYRHVLAQIKPNGLFLFHFLCWRIIVKIYFFSIVVNEFVDLLAFFSIRSKFQSSSKLFFIKWTIAQHEFVSKYKNNFEIILWHACSHQIQILKLYSLDLESKLGPVIVLLNHEHQELYSLEVRYCHFSNQLDYIMFERFLLQISYVRLIT